MHLRIRKNNYVIGPAFKSNVKNAFGFGSQFIGLNVGKGVFQYLEEFGMIPEMNAFCLSLKG